MDFGNDQHPKWTEKEEMTLMFLAAFVPEFSAADIQGELNALFGNDRSLKSIQDRLKKNERGSAAMADLIAANPVKIAHFWKRKGVVDADVGEPAFVADGNTIREVSSGGFPPGKVASVFGGERQPKGPTL